VTHINGDTQTGNNTASDGSVTTVGIPINATWALLIVAAVNAFAFYRKQVTVSG